MKLTAAFVAFVLAAACVTVRAADAQAVPNACSPSTVLNAVGDALTTGSDAAVLHAALAGEKRLTNCGDKWDAIGAELIAADAYGDVHEPAKRCAALYDAQRKARHLGEHARADAIGRAAAGCR